MTREEKIREDGESLKQYEERLRKTKKAYHQEFRAFAINQRRSRALALGECCLKAMDEVRGLNRTKPLIPGTLDYLINEQKVTDADGVKGFSCVVAYRVVSEEPEYTDEWIKNEIAETFEKMMIETDEMFPQEEQKDGQDA